MPLINKLEGDPSYIQVADSIAERIAAGEYAIRLPAERALAAEYDVAYQTLRRSMKLLRERGLIITRQGRGTFVAPSARPQPAAGEGEGEGEGEGDGGDR